MTQEELEGYKYRELTKDISDVPVDKLTRLNYLRIKQIEDNTSTSIRNQHSIYNTIYNSMPDWKTYLAIFIGMIASIAACNKLNKLEKKVQQTTIQTSNVIGGPQLDKFYIIDQDTAYVSIDGKVLK